MVQTAARPHGRSKRVCHVMLSSKWATPSHRSYMKWGLRSPTSIGWIEWIESHCKVISIFKANYYFASWTDASLQNDNDDDNDDGNDESFFLFQRVPHLYIGRVFEGEKVIRLNELTPHQRIKNRVLNGPHLIHGGQFICSVRQQFDLMLLFDAALEI